MVSAKVAAKISLIALSLGGVFALGQSIHLGFAYLSTFSHLDFLLYSFLILPFALMAAILISASHKILVEPLVPALRLRRRVKEQEKLLSKESGHDLFDFLSKITISLTVICGFIFLEHSLRIIIIGTAIAALFIFLRNRFPAIEEESNLSAPIESQDSEKPDTKSLISLLPLAGVLVFFLGAFSIDMQNKKEPDVEVLFRGEDTYEDVNLLASNSANYAFFRDGFIEIIPRSEVRAIRYLKKRRT